MFDEMLSLINMQNPGNWLEPGLCHYLIIGIFIFLTGLLIAISSKNTIKILIGLGFMINAAVLNFIAANALISKNTAVINLITPQNNTVVENFAPLENIIFNFSLPQGQAAGLIITAFAAINIIAGLGLILAIYYRFKNIDTTGLNNLKSADCPDYDDFKTEDDI